MTRRVLIPAALVAVATAVAAPLASSTPGTPPMTVTATKLSADRPPFLAAGRIVSDATLTNRVYVNRQNGFSMSSQRNAQYAACTINAGKTWRICTPVLHVNAANAPDVVTQVGADHQTYWVYGGPGGGQSIVSSNDAGRTWYRTYMPGTPIAVTLSHAGTVHKLIAFVATGRTPLLYTSTDAGHTWHYTSTL
jgi:hypothetical protein